MTDEYTDPSGNTAQFQAFANREEPVPAKSTPAGMIIAVVAVVIVFAAIAAYLVMG
jgi:hypothetical protein